MQLCPDPQGLQGAVGGPNTQPCLESPGWDHSPVAFELLPTSRPPGIGPGMAASRERKQLGWQPAHSARAVSRETGQAGLRPPPQNGALARPPGQGQVPPRHQSLKRVLSMPDPRQRHHLTRRGPGSPVPIYSAQLSMNHNHCNSTWSRRFSSQIIIRTATTAADTEQAPTPYPVPYVLLHGLLPEGDAIIVTHGN